MKFLPALLIFLYFTPLFLYAGPPKSSRYYISDYENVLGTSMELKVSATSSEAAKKAENAVLHEIARLSAILSGYDPNSEFSRWERTMQVAVRVSPELFNVLGLFDRWRTRTGGALDASAEAVTRVWKEAAKRGQVPAADELARAVAEVKQRQWELDSARHTATHLGNSPLMLNSFAKSYIIRRAADAGRNAAGADAIVVNIGGDLVVSGDIPEAVAVSDPKADAENDAPMTVLRVSNAAVATSGNYRRGELINGRWYSHIVDPRTGQPADGILSATVVAPDATDAGALATAFNVLSTAESVKLAATVPGVEYLIVTKEGKKTESAGWKALEEAVTGSRGGSAMDADREMAADRGTGAGAGATGGAGAVGGAGALGAFEMVINLEINLQNQGTVKRPYVAVWVEDENHAPVRTITVWHGADKYLPELKSWYLKYRGLYATDRSWSGSHTSATRSAGKYTLKWDGLDDQGNPVKPGHYFVKIEASREHGTYQLMRQEIDCDDKSKVINLAGNIEIAAASLDYRKTDNGQ
jgi:thiamine biosynthesis lipoprotein ApbE